jgi:thiamine transporter ThiT
MARWLVVSSVYAAMFLMSSRFDVMQAIVGGLMCGAASIGALKLFGMDNKE